MKESYIQQVKRHLTLTRKQKQEVLRDLEEIFASALEHVESPLLAAADDKNSREESLPGVF